MLVINDEKTSKLLINRGLMELKQKYKGEALILKEVGIRVYLVFNTAVDSRVINLPGKVS